MLTFELCLFIRGRMARPLLLCLLLRAGSPVAGTRAGGFVFDVAANAKNDNLRQKLQKR